MQRLYETLLYLYPADFRREFAEEMAWCFSQRSADCRNGVQRVKFLAREVIGVIGCASDQQVLSLSKLFGFSRRVVMISKNKRFRFPIAAIALMAVSFALVLYAIRLARSISYSFSGSEYVHKGQVYAYHPDHLSFLQTFGFAFGVTVVCTVIVLAALNLTRRAGVHRLAEARTWPRP